MKIYMIKLKSGNTTRVLAEDLKFKITAPAKVYTNYQDAVYSVNNQAHILSKDYFTPPIKIIIERYDQSGMTIVYEKDI